MMKISLMFNDGMIRPYPVIITPYIPRKGDTIIDCDLTYTVKEVIWNFDNNTISISVVRHWEINKISDRDHNIEMRNKRDGKD